MQKQEIERQEQHRQQEHRQRIAQMRNERQNEKSKIADAILMHKKEEAKQAKFIGQQTKNRANHN